MACCDAGVVEEGTVYVEARFWNPLTKALETPSVATFTTRDPSEDETDYDTPSVLITETEPGVLLFAFPIPFGSASEGRWYVRARGTAGLIVQGSITFTVPASVFA